MDKLQSNTLDNNEISFIELSRILWRQKITILFTVLMVLCICIIYLKYKSPVYEAKAYISAPRINNFTQLNKLKTYDQDSIFEEYTDSYFYDLFIKNLLSEGLKRDFYEKIFLTKDQERSNVQSKRYSYKTYLKKFQIKINPQLQQYTLVVYGNSASSATKFINQYLKIANDNARAQLNKIIDSKIKVKLFDLKEKLERTQKIALLAQLEKIKRYKNELRIAQRENLKEYSTNSLINNNNLFMLGTKVLTSKIEDLKKQKFHERYLNKIKRLSIDYNFYLNFTMKNLQATMYEIDGGIVASDIPVSPKPNFIILFGLVSGVFLGVFLALALDKFKNNNSGLDFRIFKTNIIKAAN